MNYPIEHMARFVIGTSDILLGNYPESRAQIVRKVFTGFGIAVTISELLNGSSGYATVAGLMYLGGRFGPYIEGHRERWRF